RRPHRAEALGGIPKRLRELGEPARLHIELAQPVGLALGRVDPAVICRGAQCGRQDVGVAEGGKRRELGGGHGFLPGSAAMTAAAVAAVAAAVASVGAPRAALWAVITSLPD